MRDDKWVKRWIVYSYSSNGHYVVGQDKDGNYGCSCPGWTRNVAKRCPQCGSYLSRTERQVNYCWKCKQEVSPITERRDCKHILKVKEGGGKILADAVLDRLEGKK